MNFYSRLTLIIIFLMFGQMISAQTKSSGQPAKLPTGQTTEDYRKVVISDSAINLAVAVGQEANKLTDLRQKINLKLEAARILIRPEPNESFQILQSAWCDANDEAAKKEVYGIAALKNSIIVLTKQIAPDEAGKWLEQVKKQETADAEETAKNPSPDRIRRQTADTLASAALAKINSQPQQAVSELIASFQKTGVISNRLIDAVKILN